MATNHAAKEMDTDGLGYTDIAHRILTGKIANRQHDRQTGEKKYVIEGWSLGNDKAQTVVKIAPTGNVVIIPRLPTVVRRVFL